MFLLALAPTFAQTLAPTLLDNFNQPDSPAVSAGWVKTETTVGTGAAIVGNQLRLSSGVLSKDFGARDVSICYRPVLNQNAEPLTWLFNLQQLRPDPSGFGHNNYGAAFVLTSSSAHLRARPGRPGPAPTGAAADAGKTTHRP